MNAWGLEPQERQAGLFSGAVPGGADRRGGALSRRVQLAGCAGARGTGQGRYPARYAGRGQLRWLIAATAHLPMSGAQARAHFDSAFLTQISPAMLNQGLHGATDVKLLSIGASEPRKLVVVVSTSGVLPRAQVALTT